MSCSGACFSLVALAGVLCPDTPTGDTGDESWWELPSSSIARTIDPEPSEPGSEVFTPLKPWQTRVLRLYPGPESAEDTRIREPLQADLLVVNLYSLGEVALQQSEQIIEYTAMSYVWGSQKTEDYSDFLLCNGNTIPISENVAAMLKALRHPARSQYLWLDQLCINQDDQEEKSLQVAKMLGIYQKAISVTVWLGDSDDPDSHLALAALSHISNVEQAITSFDNTEHKPSCEQNLKSLYEALIGFCNRPWLFRTWIRQEVYGAKRLIVRCGKQRLDWNHFVQATSLLEMLRQRVRQTQISAQPELRICRAIKEAQLSAFMPLGGIKPPRDVIDVLLKSQDYGVKDKRDTFYAVLGMCNISTTTRNHKNSTPVLGKTVLVDYTTKTLVDVYRDATLYVICRQTGPEDLARLWNSYCRSTLHDNGLPSWTIDWRYGVLDESDRGILQDNLGFQEGVGRYRNYQGRVVDKSASWYPLWHGKTRGLSTISPHRPDHWRFPEPHESEPDVLKVHARMLNYVAYLSDYTCDLEEFFRLWSRPSDIGPAGITIHAPGSPRKGTYLFSRKPKNWIDFSPAVHRWRIAILGTGESDHICLVPSNARIGDLVVALAANTLPMLIRPIGGDGTAGGLVPSTCPRPDLIYDETLQPSLRKVTWTNLPAFAWDKGYTTLICMLILLVLSFVAFLVTYVIKEPAAYIVLAVYATLDLVVFWIQYHFLKRVNKSWTTVEGSDYADGLTEQIFFPGTVTLLFSGVLAFTCVLVAAIGKPPMVGANMILFVIQTVQVAWVLFLMFWCSLTRLEDEVRRARRRREVLQHLDTATQTIGQDYEFLGPIFVEAKWTKWRYPVQWFDWLKRLSINASWKFFTYRDQRRHQGQDSSGLEADDLFHEIFENSNISHTSPGAWLRPMQELRLH